MGSSPGYAIHQFPAQGKWFKHWAVIYPAEKYKIQIMIATTTTIFANSIKFCEKQNEISEVKVLWNYKVLYKYQAVLFVPNWSTHQWNKHPTNPSYT